MIKVSVEMDKESNILKISAENHGDPVVCSAVSALLINCVNSLDAFTKDEFECEIEDEGFLSISFDKLENGSAALSGEAKLLISSLMLGLDGIAQEYEEEIKIMTNIK